MKTGISSEFIREIPKTDLHVHLDGSLRLPSLIEMAQAGKVKLPSYEVEGLKELVFKSSYASLPEYLKGFMYTCAVLNTPENLERTAYELAQDNLAEGVRYMEVRFAPQLHSRSDFSLEQVLQAVCQGMDRAKKEHNGKQAVLSNQDIPFEYGIIACALRSFNPHMAAYYAQIFDVMSYAPKKEIFAAASLEMARAAAEMVHEKGLPVVGFDLAGEESGFPAIDHWTAYQYAHSRFLKKTVHAGEAYGPESIFQAITECHANRLGHGTFLFAGDMIRDPSIKDPKAFVRDLAEYIASRRITIEVCLTSNLQTTPIIRRVADHPLKQMIDHNMSVSICTDNRLVSNTTVTRELELVAQGMPITRSQFRNIVIAGFKGSFFPGSYNEKRSYVRRVIDRYEELETKYMGKTSQEGSED
ncbi:MAG TPA: adenosine deaminase family protein [Verrucomicrobia bacterium]|nr:MAG: adenosine deaminase [Lentisphaerae bacterium GWF2_57_35]HBA83844.1 adenosine deaminase family protein [Verrucomicrobiota bacterium]